MLNVDKILTSTASTNQGSSPSSAAVFRCPAVPATGKAEWNGNRNRSLPRCKRANAVRDVLTRAAAPCWKRLQWLVIAPLGAEMAVSCGSDSTSLASGPSPRTSPSWSGTGSWRHCLLTHSFSCALNLFTPRPCLCFVRALLCSALQLSTSANRLSNTSAKSSPACHSFYLPDPRFIRSALEIPPAHNTRPFCVFLFPSFLG